MPEITIEELSTFCKRKGFVYPNSEIYGGMAGFFDYGPFGVELKNNIKKEWWKKHVIQREDIAGIDGSIISHPNVWVASGHVASFEDIMLRCSNPKCGNRVRADTIIEEKLKISADSMKGNEVNELIKKHNIICSKCESDFKETEQFNLMFKTSVGSKEDASSVAYLRPETAQQMFINFKLVVDNARLKLPFGIAQMGRAFRNEISPRDFLFRCREFEQMEIEYFVHPEKIDECPYIGQVYDTEIIVYSSEMQESHKEAKKMKIKDAVEKGIIKTRWHAYWLAFEFGWFTSLGANPDNFRIRQHLQKEKSHYALDTWDLEYNFPFGWKELEGLANRTDFDLQQHIKHSKTDLSIFDEETKKKIIPYVVCEPSLGVERTFIVFMLDAYHYDKERDNVVLKLHPKLAPVKAGIFPLINKPELIDKAREIYTELRNDFNVSYDQSGSVGRRYARNDEIGTPFCITVDFESLRDKQVTIRDRDSTVQKRVNISDLKEIMNKLVNEGVNFRNV